jgi:iron complex outermembrane receptor protein
MKFYKLNFFVLSLIGLMLNSESFAQSEGSQVSSGIEEIIVTARKKEEPLQETPVTITAITSEKIQKLYATDLQDLGMSVPNLLIK